MSAILSFNLGVEVAQLTIVFILNAVVVRYFIQKPDYEKQIMHPVSIGIASLGLLIFLAKIGF